MFTPMRRYPQQLSREETEAILRRGTHGTFALISADGWPYSVPASYVYEDGKLYFHCARSGHKLTCIQNHPQVSFSVVDKDEVIQDTYTTHYRSAILFGTARMLEGEEKTAALLRLAEKYSPSLPLERHMKEIGFTGKAAAVIQVSVEHMTGKESIELVRAKREGKL